MPTIRLLQGRDNRKITALEQRGQNQIDGFRKKLATRLRRAGYKVPRRNLLTTIDGYGMQIKFGLYSFGKHSEYAVTDDGNPIVSVRVESWSYYHGGYGFNRRMKVNGDLDLGKIYDEIVKIVEQKKFRTEEAQKKYQRRKKLATFLKTLGITAYPDHSGISDFPGTEMHISGAYKYGDVEFTFSVSMEDHERLATVVNFLRETFPENVSDEQHPVNKSFGGQAKKRKRT